MKTGYNFECKIIYTKAKPTMNPTKQSAGVVDSRFLPKLPDNEPSAHCKQLGRECIKRAMEKWGTGWKHLSNEQKRGAIALEVVSTIMGAINTTDDKSSLAKHCQDVALCSLYMYD